MANFLILDKNFVFNGLGTLTHDVLSSQVFTVQIQSTLQSTPPTGAGSGTARDQGIGVTGGFGGAGSGAQLGLGSGAKGLGFGDSGVSDNASGFSTGYGAGAGGGGEGFSQGDQGLGHGGVGQGFGPTNGYQQPPADIHSSQTTGPAVASGVSFVVNQNGSPVYTSPTVDPTQSSFEMKKSFLFAATDVVTVVISSSTASDETLNSLKTNVSIGTGV